MKPRLVGVIHLPPLPGSPRSALDARACARSAAADARALAEAGFDHAIVENFGDAPFFPGRVPAETVAAMTACAVAVREAAPDLPLGINVLRNDAESALAIAVVAGAACIRVNVLTGARVTDQGLIEGCAATLFRARRALGAEGIEVWGDVDVKHSAPLLATRPLADEVGDLVARSFAAAVLVTGEGTGRAVDGAKLTEVQKAAHGRVPVLVASGATIDASSPRSRATPTASSSGALSARTASPAGRSIPVARGTSRARFGRRSGRRSRRNRRKRALA